MNLLLENVIIFESEFKFFALSLDLIAKINDNIRIDFAFRIDVETMLSNGRQNLRCNLVFEFFGGGKFAREDKGI